MRPRRARILEVVQAAATALPTHTWRIRTNRLLEGAENTATLEQAMAGILLAHEPVSLDEIVKVHDAYGEGGLYRFIYLAGTHKGDEYERFRAVIWALIVIAGLPEMEPSLDNDVLPQGDALDRFNHNVLLPSFARKLYNPGRHPGYLVYGLGGPKILVSHPFAGGKGEYAVYVNSGEVMKNLMLQGYSGTFLLLDNLRGLNREIDGVPSWLLWFSLIAAHSDVVLFLRERNGDFTDAQRQEIAFTPDRVQKKVVEIDELTWAEEAAPDHGPLPITYLGTSGLMSEAEWLAEEAKHAGPMIDHYAAPGLPRDRLVRIAEGGERTAFPLDYPIYAPGS